MKPTLNNKHAKSVHAFVMREALPIPYNARIRARYTRNTPLNNAIGHKWSVWTTYVVGVPGPGIQDTT